MVLSTKVKNSLMQIDNDLSIVLNHIITTQEALIKDLHCNRTLINNINDGLLQKVLISQEKTLKNQNELSVKLDKIVSCGAYSGKTISQKKGKTAKKKSTTTRMNKLTWIRDQYSRLGWKFWDDIVENAEEETKKVLEDPKNKKELEKKTGKQKIEKEAALIYLNFKKNSSIENWVKDKFEEYIEALQKNENADKIAERDEVSE